MRQGAPPGDASVPRKRHPQHSGGCPPASGQDDDFQRWLDDFAEQSASGEVPAAIEDLIG